MGVQSKNMSNVQLTRTTQAAVNSRRGLASLINKVLGNGDPIEQNTFIREHLAFHVKTALTLSNIMKADSKLPINVKLTGQDSYVNLDSAFQKGIEIGIAHQRPKFGEKSIEERLVCQYGYLEHELSHLRYADPNIWSEMLRFIGAMNGQPEADPNIFDQDNLELIKHLVNIIGDGHDETRFMMQNRYQFLKTIVAKDEIIGNYKFDAEKTGDNQLDQVIGNCLMYVLPNKATYQVDDQFMTDETKDIFYNEIVPHLDAGLEGTYDDILESSKQIYLILQKHDMLPHKSQEQKELENFLQQLAKNNPDVFQQMLQQGQQAGQSQPGGQSGQGQPGQGVGASSNITITLPNSKSNERQNQATSSQQGQQDGEKGDKKDKNGSGSGSGEKGDKKDGQGGGAGEKSEEQGQQQGQGQGQGQDGQQSQDQGQGQGQGQSGQSGQSGQGQQGQGQGQDGQSEQSSSESSSSGREGSNQTPGGNSAGQNSGTPQFVEKNEAEKARQDAVQGANKNTNAANKNMQQLANNNIETESAKTYTTVKVNNPTITTDHLRKNLELVRDSQKETEKMKRLLKQRLNMGSVPKTVRRQRTGRLDRRGFVRQDETESELIFERKLELPGPKARIYMLGDMSGSMGDQQIYDQAKAMTISAEAAKSLNIPIEVSYYSGSSYSGSPVYMAKTFKQKNGVISLGIDRGSVPGGGTPTASAIDSAAKRMVEDGYTNPEESKIFYVLTDGAPDSETDVKNKINELGKKYKGRVRIIGVFMKTHRGDQAPRSFFESFDTPYSESVVVDSIDKVPEDFTKILVGIMKKRKFN